MKRRAFITLLGSAAAAWPRAVRAQQSALPVIGYLGSGSLGSRRDWVAAFHRGLNETGYVEGQNVTIEYRWAEGQENRLPALAADLVRRRVTVIAAMGAPTVLPAKAATATIPVVFSTGTDPVQDGFVPSLNRPGGNITGVTVFTSALGPKRLELLHEMVPRAELIGFLVDPNLPDAETQSNALREAAPALALQLHILRVSTERDLDTAFATLVQQRVGALLIGNGSFFLSRPEQLVALSARHVVPTIYAAREFVAAGGLISYGNSTAESYRQAGVYIGRILKGEKPADLPVMQPTKFELVINLKAAKTIGLRIPESFLLRADEVIE
jgi:putative tryptophan/tyrosine transport system substrate-binding protein